MRNFILLLGRLTAEPKAKTSKSGKGVTTFSLAIDGGKNENGESNVTFFDCEAWEKMAETCAKYLHKGDLVQVNGEMVHRAYMDKTNAKRDYYGVRVNGIEFLTPKAKEEKKQEDTIDEDLPY